MGYSSLPDNPLQKKLPTSSESEEATAQAVNQVSYPSEVRDELGKAPQKHIKTDLNKETQDRQLPSQRINHTALNEDINSFLNPALNFYYQIFYSCICAVSA